MWQIALCIAELGLALSNLHSRSVLSCHLKPWNFLIAADGHRKFPDLGLAKNLSRCRRSSFCGDT
jgi:serine/threonine protein kinase